MLKHHTPGSLVVCYGLASITRHTESITTATAYPFVSTVFCSRRAVVSSRRLQGSVDRIQHDWLNSWPFPSCYCGFQLLNSSPFNNCTQNVYSFPRRLHSSYSSNGVADHQFILSFHHWSNSTWLIYWPFRPWSCGCSFKTFDLPILVKNINKMKKGTLTAKKICSSNLTKFTSAFRSVIMGVFCIFLNVIILNPKSFGEHVFIQKDTCPIKISINYAKNWTQL